MERRSVSLGYRVMIVTIVVGMLFGPVGKTSAFLETIGDFLSLGANTVRELQQAIQIAGSEVRATLEQLEGTLLDLMNELQETYQNNLNITLDSIDALTRNKILELENMMLTVNELLQDDIRLISDEAKGVIQEAALRARVLSDDIKRDLQDVVIVAGETGVFLIERTAENIVIIASVILLAVGLLIFVGLLLRGGVKGTGFAAILGYLLLLAYVALFGALILVPQFRGFVMTSVGIGLRDRLETIINQPNVFAVIPDEIKVGETEEIEIWGSQLTPNGEQPTITIAGSAVPVAAIGGDRIVLDVSAVVASAAAEATDSLDELQGVDEVVLSQRLVSGPDSGSEEVEAEALPIGPIRDGVFVKPIDFGDLVRIDPGVIIKPGVGLPGGGVQLPSGSATLKLDYATFEDVATVVRIIPPVPPVPPADLRISSFSITPSGLVRNQNATSTITIRNDGGTAAANFQLRWKPTATHPGLSTNVSSLGPNSSQTFTFNHAYSTVGTFDSVATVDVLNSVAESNEGNNSSQRSVAVAEQPPRLARVTVTFTGVTVHDDADPWPKGDGEIWLTFDINGSTGRFPTSGTSGIGSGSTKSFTRTFTVTVAEGETLNVFVNGKEGDDDSDDDQMGTVSKTFTTGQNWGSGAHNDKSSCPDGCYTIHY
ncbi:MAG: hypothetical protein K8J31_13345, partial [Anaerolineae bacterium]|nr:hypothetical protein [Anaerolineae bacterium]